MKWALTYTFNYDKNEARLFKDFDDTLAEAKSWSKEELGAPIYLWKLTTGNPIKWMRVTQRLRNFSFLSVTMSIDTHEQVITAKL